MAGGRGRIDVPVSAKWREWIKKNANSIPTLAGTSIDTERAQLVFNLETLLGLAGGGGGGGAAAKVQIVDANGQPIASDYDGSDALRVGVVNDTVPVEILEPRTGDALTTLIAGVDPNVVGTLPVSIPSSQQPIDVAIPTADQPIKVTVTNSQSTERNTYAAIQTATTQAQMTRCSVEVQADTTKPMYNLRVWAVLFSGVSIGSTFMTFQVGRPSTWSSRSLSKGKNVSGLVSSSTGFYSAGKVSGVRRATGGGQVLADQRFQLPSEFIQGYNVAFGSFKYAAYGPLVIPKVDPSGELGFALDNVQGTTSANNSIQFSLIWEEE